MLLHNLHVSVISLGQVSLDPVTCESSESKKRIIEKYWDCASREHYRDWNVQVIVDEDPPPVVSFKENVCFNSLIRTIGRWRKRLKMPVPFPRIQGVFIFYSSSFDVCLSKLCQNFFVFLLHVRLVILSWFSFSFNRFC